MENDTPLDTPHPTPEQLDREYERIARGLKADGYNAAVVARKLISLHGMQVEAAEALTGRIFGSKKVDAFRGDSMSRIALGLILLALGGGGLVAVVLLFDGRVRRLWPLYVALGSLAATGLNMAAVPLINGGRPR